VQFSIRGNGQQRIEKALQDELFLHVDCIAGVERFRLDRETDVQRPAGGAFLCRIPAGSQHHAENDQA
jgi:hypothetical protein